VHLEVRVRQDAAGRPGLAAVPGNVNVADTVVGMGSSTNESGTHPVEDVMLEKAVDDLPGHMNLVQRIPAGGTPSSL